VNVSSIILLEFVENIYEIINIKIIIFNIFMPYGVKITVIVEKSGNPVLCKGVKIPRVKNKVKSRTKY